jgi:hypothetical protein
MLDADERHADALCAVEQEIIQSIITTGSFSWGNRPGETIGHCEMTDAIDYYELITAAQQRNHTIAGTLLNRIIADAAERVAQVYAPYVLNDRAAALAGDA